MAFRHALYCVLLATLCLAASLWSQTVDTGFLGVATDVSGAALQGGSTRRRLRPAFWSSATRRATLWFRQRRAR